MGFGGVVGCSAPEVRSVAAGQSLSVSPRKQKKVTQGFALVSGARVRRRRQNVGWRASLRAGLHAAPLDPPAAGFGANPWGTPSGCI